MARLYAMRAQQVSALLLLNKLFYCTPDRIRQDEVLKAALRNDFCDEVLASAR